MQTLDVGFSSCPNDTFMFHGLIAGVVEVPGLQFSPVMADIEALNLRALDPARALPLTKLSASALAHVCDRYAVLGAGAALGRGCGPLVVRRAQAEHLDGLAALAGRTVAIPGEHTTAHLLLRIAFAQAGASPSFEARVMRFDRIMPAVAAGQVDAGLIIHESRFTYPEHGLVELVDLGEAWERATGLPLPLGMICADRRLGPAVVDAVEDGLRRSIEAAFAEPERARPWIRAHAQELDDEVCRRHIELYVNGFSVELGDEGRAAIDELLGRGRVSGFLPAGRDPWPYLGYRARMSNPAKQIRERACDWLIIGPVVGFTEAQTTRVLAQPYEKHRGMLELRLAKAVENVRFDEAAGGYAPVEVVGDLHRFPVSEEGGFHTVIFEPEGLEPDTRYFYEVVPEDAPREVAGCFASRQPYSLRTLPSSPGAFRFSFHSCNGLHKPPRGGTPTNMWRRLLREVTRHRDLHFALLGGDQVYCDVIREEWLREWEPTFDPACFDPSDGDARRCVEFLSQLPERYERIYRTFWRRPELRTFMGHVPCLMTWDDHEIYDGWGSYGDEELPAQQAFFSAAAACFDAFQFSLAPQRMLSSAAAGLRNNHRAYSFMVGDAAFLVLDLRSKRNIKSREASAVLGDEQWAWFDAEIEELARRRPKQIVVVLSIPLVHMGAEVEHIMPSAAEMHDDVLDHWSSRPNRNDALRLVGNLFRLRRQTGANVLLLSGDVHVGTIGHIASRDPRTLLDGEVESRLHQGVSSAIAYEAPIGISANVVRYLVQREHPMRGGYLGRIEDVVAERNFAVISAHPDKVFRLHLYRESSEVPDQFYLPVK